MPESVAHHFLSSPCDIISSMIRKEEYPKQLFGLIIEYAKKKSEISGLELIETIKNHTPIYYLIGNYDWEFKEDSIYWKEFLEKEIIPENNSCELYFEESNIEGFVEKLEKYYPDAKYVNRLMTHSWGQKVIRFYDPDGNLIEVGTPM